MARIRSIHPSLFTDENFVELSSFCRLFLLGLWTECDDFGLFEWKPKRIKMRVFPADNIEPDQLLQALADNDFIIKYDIDGKNYGAIKNFCRWQRPKKPTNFCPLNNDIAAFVRADFRTSGELVGNWWGKDVSEGRKEGKEEGRKEGKDSPLPPREKKIEIVRFDEFWDLFPRQRRGNKKSALRAYERVLEENRASEEEIILGVKNYGRSQDVANGYAKGAVAWLNDDRWSDDFGSVFDERSAEDVAKNIKKAKLHGQRMKLAGLKQSRQVAERYGEPITEIDENIVKLSEELRQCDV